MVLNVVFAQHVAGILRHTVRGSASRHAAGGHGALGPLVRAPLQEEAGLDASEVEVCEVMAGCPWTCVSAMDNIMSVSGNKSTFIDIRRIYFLLLTICTGPRSAWRL